MASLVDIANFALDLVGNQQILALTDNTQAARKCTLHINQAIRETLKDGKWKSAKKRATLSQLTVGPSFGWTYQYQLPNDYIRMVFFNDTDPCDVREPIFEIEGRLLMTEETSAAIEYVADLTETGNDINAADPALTELFALTLATKLAWTLQQSVTLKEQMLQEYAQKLRRALASDAQEQKNSLVNRLNDSEWLRRRNNSTNG